MRVKIVAACKGSVDGITLRQYEVGQVVELPDHLARSFVVMRWAEPCQPEPSAAVIIPDETKVIEPVVFKRGPGRPRKVR